MLRKLHSFAHFAVSRILFISAVAGLIFASRIFHLTSSVNPISRLCFLLFVCFFVSHSPLPVLSCVLSFAFSVPHSPSSFLDYVVSCFWRWCKGRGVKFCGLVKGYPCPSIISGKRLPLLVCGSNLDSWLLAARQMSGYRAYVRRTVPTPSH